MKSRKEGYSYIILQDGEKYPIKVNRKRTEKALRDLNKYTVGILKLMSDLYKKDNDLYYFIKDTVVSSYSFDFSEGDNYILREIRDSSEDLLNQLLENQDDIPAVENLTTLADLGFRESFFGGHNEDLKMWEKVLIDTDEMEVQEEVILYKTGEMKRRKRKILWDKVDYGKSSRSIKYTPLKMTKKLENALKLEKYYTSRED